MLAVTPITAQNASLFKAIRLREHETTSTTPSGLSMRKRKMSQMWYLMPLLIPIAKLYGWMRSRYAS